MSIIGIIAIITPIVSIFIFKHFNQPPPPIEETDWVQTNGPFGGIIHTIEIDPDQPNVIYAGGAGGVFKSTDSGTTWSNMPRFLEGNIRVEEIIMSPDNPLILYARTECPSYAPGAEIYRSLDGGIIWSNIGQGKKFEALTLNDYNPTDVIGCTRTYEVLLSGTRGNSLV